VEISKYFQCSVVIGIPIYIEPVRWNVFVRIALFEQEFEEGFMVKIGV
jgi:hypothetical protein